VEGSWVPCCALRVIVLSLFWAALFLRTVQYFMRNAMIISAKRNRAATHKTIAMIAVADRGLAWAFTRPTQRMTERG